MPGDSAGWCIFSEQDDSASGEKWDVRGQQGHDPQIGDAQLARWFIHHQIGLDYARRTAYLLLNPVKEHLDLLIMPPNKGKSTWGTLLKAAMGLAVQTTHVKGLQTTQQFSNGINLVVNSRLVVVDEASNSNDKLPSALVNELGDETVVIHNKGKDSTVKRRTANIIVKGGGIVDHVGGRKVYHLA